MKILRKILGGDDTQGSIGDVNLDEKGKTFSKRFRQLQFTLEQVAKKFKKKIRRKTSSRSFI
jgi:hypothetical protein